MSFMAVSLQGVEVEMGRGCLFAVGDVLCYFYIK